MLSLSLLPDEYLSINNGQIIVHLIRVAGGRAHLRIKACFPQNGSEINFQKYAD